MAGDWIKLRIDLQSHPKIVRILSATGADKFRVIGGLHAVWSVFDTHSVDGVLPGYTPKALDHVIGWEGFAEAMMDVGWLAVHEPEGLVMPEFGEHNGQSAKRRAEDQKRKRDSRNGPQSVRNLSAVDADRNGTREEKRREEVSPSLREGEDAQPRAKSLKVSDLVARGVDEKHAKDWMAVRRQKKAPLTESVMDGMEREAKAAGITLGEAVRIAAERSWQAFKADWVSQRPGNSGAPVNRQQQVEDANAKVLAEIMEMEDRRLGRISGPQNSMDLDDPMILEGELIDEP